MIRTWGSCRFPTFRLAKFPRSACIIIRRTSVRDRRLRVASIYRSRGFAKSSIPRSPNRCPRGLRRLDPDLSTRRQFSVSEIEQAAVSTPVSTRSAGAVIEASATTPTGGAAADRRDDGHAIDAAVLGTLVHDVLERVDLQHPAEYPALLDRALRVSDEAANPALRTAAAARIDAFVGSTAFGVMAEAACCHREFDFLLRWPLAAESGEAIVISGQIDCLVQTAKGRWQVFDYKTGRAPDGAPETLLEKYDVQLTLYALAVQQAIGRLPDSVEIVLLGDEVLRIPLDLDERLLADVAERIDAAVRRLRGQPD